MSRRSRTFVIRPDPPDREVTQEELQALAAQLGLIDNEDVSVTIVGNALRITLTPRGIQGLMEGGR